MASANESHQPTDKHSTISNTVQAGSAGNNDRAAGAIPRAQFGAVGFEIGVTSQ